MYFSLATLCMAVPFAVGMQWLNVKKEARRRGVSGVGEVEVEVAREVLAEEGAEIFKEITLYTRSRGSTYLYAIEEEYLYACY